MNRPRSAQRSPVVTGGRPALAQMTVEVGEVLARYGYHLDARGLAELRKRLWLFLYGDSLGDGRGGDQ